MADKIKEVYVGAILSEDRKGVMATTPVYLAGRPIPVGIYNADELPLGWKHGWAEFVKNVRRHQEDILDENGNKVGVNGHGFTVIYEGKPRPELKKAMDDHADKIKREEKERTMANTPKSAEVIKNA